MNGKGHLTIRARNEQVWILHELERVAKEKKRSLSFIVFEILETHFPKPKKKKK